MALKLLPQLKANIISFYPTSVAAPLILMEISSFLNNAPTTTAEQNTAQHITWKAVSSEK